MILLPSVRLLRAVAASALLVSSLAVVSTPTAAVAARAAAPTTTRLTVNKGGDRTGPQTVAGLPGATFDFYAGVSGTRPRPGDPPTASCTTTAGGACSVNVPGETGRNRGYWIIERSAPSGWRLLETFDTGGGSTSPTVYNGVFTGTVYNGQSYSFPAMTTGNTNRTARGTQWADARDNPPYPTKCGLDIALLIDVSGSIGPSLPDVKAAANGFVDALTGTPSTIGLYTFSTNAATRLNPTPVSDTAGANVVKAAINSLTAGGTTNWDAGLFEVASAPSHFDAVIMLTDGNPTVYGPPPVQGPGNYTRFAEVEQGVFSANAIKAVGTKIVAVGVGAGVSGSADNLQAVSGPVRGEDFIQTDYAELEAVFRALALRTCAGTISVVKKVIPIDGTPADAVPTGGWTISTTTPLVTPSSGVTADDTGAVSFNAQLDGEPSRPVTLAETLKPNYVLVQQDGLNATCTRNGESATVTNSGALGFTVDATATGIVTCVILNQDPAPVASVQVDKTWVINGETFPDPDQPTEFQANLLLTGQHDPAFGVAYDGYAAGDSVTVDETIDSELLPPNCTNVASGDIGEHTLVADLNRFSITNTVTCTTTLQLQKTVTNPYGEPEPASSWTLSAYPPDSTDPAFTGTTGVSGPVTPDVAYSMGESSVPGYSQMVMEGAVIVPPATGSWSCSLVVNNRLTSSTEFDGADGRVAVSIGQTAVCTATNIADPATVTLTKDVTNQYGGTATDRDWILRADPLPDDNSATPIAGRTGDPSVTNATAYPNVAYHLTETDGPAGYEQVGEVHCVLTGTETPVPTPGQTLTPGLGQNITCTWRNTDQQPTITLEKQVHGGPANPAQWTVTADPGPHGTPISGPAGSPAVTSAGAMAGVAYRLSESNGPRSYQQSADPTCVLTGTHTDIPVVDSDVRLLVGQHITCTFTNRYVPPLPVTGVKLTGLIATGASSVLVGVALMVLTSIMRRRAEVGLR